MRIPKQVRVGAQTYSVEFDASIRDNGVQGECNFRQLAIRLLDDRPPTRVQETFLHELIEALNYEYQVGLRHKQIADLGMAMYQVLRDNPEVFADDATDTTSHS